MELVYLWVEKYKNIENQGFNFSPRFDCNFDKRTNENEKLDLKNSILSIKEKNDSINLYPNNINVTAIVGENGSAKSTLVELITFFRIEKIGNILENKILILVFEENDTLYIPDMNFIDLSHSFEKINIQIINKTKFNIQEGYTHASELFDISIFLNDLSNFTDQSKIHESLKIDKYESLYNGYHILYENDTKDYSLIQKEFDAKYAFINSKDDKFFHFLNEKFLFSKMSINIDVESLVNFNFLNEEDKDIFKEIKKYFYDFSGYTLSEEALIYKKDYENRYTSEYSKIQKEYLIYKMTSFLQIKNYYRLINNFSRDFKEGILKEKYLKNVFKEIEIQITPFSPSQNIKSSYNILEKKRLSISYFNNLIINLNKAFNYIDKSFIDLFKDKKGLLKDYKSFRKELIKFNHYKTFIKIVSKNFKLVQDRPKDILSIKFDKISSSIINNFNKKLNKNINFATLYNSGQLYMNFLHETNDNYTYQNLSTGEKSLLKFLVNFVFTINNLDYSKRSVIFFDEIECSLHPIWQKKIFNIILKLISKKMFIENKTKWHFIFLTHSPFILSDIPKENVVFLKNGKQEYPFKENEQTFGANIHTLLSHGFFMEDGLMGEFAKSKIEAIKNFYDDVKKSENPKDEFLEKYISNIEEFKNIQKIIGEPFLKTIIGNYLEELELILSDEDLINKELKELKSRITHLKKLRNDKN